MPLTSPTLTPQALTRESAGVKRRVVPVGEFELASRQLYAAERYLRATDYHRSRGQCLLAQHSLRLVSVHLAAAEKFYREVCPDLCASILDNGKQRTGLNAAGYKGGRMKGVRSQEASA